MSKGFVYILTNPSMPGLVKIGKTTRDVESRANELYQTGVPTPFEVREYFLTPDCHEAEALAHDALAEWRVSAAREFFIYDVESAVRIISDIVYEQVIALVCDYLPDHQLISAYHYVDEGHIAFLAHGTDRNDHEIALAIGELTADDIRPAIDRYDQRIAARKAKREAGNA